MEALLDAADALVVARNGYPDAPDFDIPEEFRSLSRAEDLPHLQVKECPDDQTKGLGWFAATNIPQGTLLAVDKPIAMVMDWQEQPQDQTASTTEHTSMQVTDNPIDSEDDDEEQEGILNELLTVKLLQKIIEQPALWTDTISSLHPDQDATTTLPPFVTNDEAIFIEFEKLIQQLPQQLSAQDIAKRLPLIVRYNVLSVETCPELLSYAGGGHAGLAGQGLYHAVSFFNHSHQPNASRYAIGDIMFVYANQDIQSGDEVCISYLEHEVLCESAHRRNLMLSSMDFEEANDNPLVEDDGPELPVVDTEVQNELMSMDPFQRLAAIEELTLQALGEKLPEDEQAEGDDAMEAGGAEWFQCDVQNLRILRAITLDGMGQTQEALKLWEECVDFTETKLPPLDESSIVMRVQAALCALYAEQMDTARKHAQVALKRHGLIFRGGVARLRRRFRREFLLSLRPDSSSLSETPQDVLWPVAENGM